jgi:hypothetical protein
MSSSIKREAVREMNGRVIGYIDFLPNGDKEVRDKYNRYIGRYDKQMNATRDHAGRFLYRGDQSSMLFNLKK